MNLDQLYRLMVAVSLLGFAMAILGIVGEVLGWWNDVGEALVSTGSLLGVLVGIGAIAIGSTRGQVREVTQGVASANRQLLKLDTIDGKLDKLDTIDVKLDKLDTIDVKLDTLDKVHVALEAQTGVLERQATILTQVRDRL